MQERRQGSGVHIEPGDAFINLNFRSDRQRSKTASLCGARPYLVRQALARGRTWQLDWMRDDLANYACARSRSMMRSSSGIMVSMSRISITPHQLNLLEHIGNRLCPKTELYLLVAESVKASHMGYFVRGQTRGLSRGRTQKTAKSSHQTVLRKA